MLRTGILNRNNIYLFGLVLLAIGIPLSNVLMSSSEFILLGYWLFDKNIINKIKAFFRNKPALVFTSIFLLHVIGLIYTSDFNYAFKDLRTKIPIILIPLIISTSPLIDGKKLRIILSFFVSAVLFSTFICFYVYLTQLSSYTKQISIFISHIRFSLDICLAICILFYFAYKESSDYSGIQKTLIYLSLIWLVYFLFILQSYTGIVIFICLILLLLLYLFIKHKNRSFRIITLVLLIAIPALLFFYIKSTVNAYFTIDKTTVVNLEKYTSRGNIYHHDLNQGIENGHYIGFYVCQDELKSSWAEKSKINIDSNDKLGQPISVTLIRFLNSKNLRKDADGVKSLSDKEISAIENGCANYIYLENNGLKHRLYKILFEYNTYQNSGYIQGHSIFQRVELWKAAVGIIKNNFWIGVGTGDMVDVYDKQLKEMNSELAGKHLRSHNQYLSIFSALGLIGFLIFIFALIYPAYLNHSFKDFYFISFFIILCLSMINEDTIESQAGVTFFAFFYALFLLSRRTLQIKQ
ncbi:MAG: O-antigen ligase family protein [Bacteroidetes bacterium]|nr:O-antigen ligase family protein [Bacteroidota bacterium]